MVVVVVIGVIVEEEGEDTEMNDKRDRRKWLKRCVCVCVCVCVCDEETCVQSVKKFEEKRV